MALKYFLEYKDTINIDHRLEIYDDAFVGVATEISGRVFLTQADVDDVLECIRGKGLRVELEANASRTFYDLYVEEEKTIKVIYKRSAVIQFIGWLNPEGWYEDYVNFEWKVGFDCTDGLGYLESLSFVDDATGFPITNKRTMLDVLSLALKRTGLLQNINIDVQIYYDGLNQSLNTLENSIVDCDRYIEDDGATIFSCDKVIRDILEPFTAIILSKNGEWFITRPIQLAENSLMTYFRYDSDGIALAPATGQLETSWVLGSFSDGFAPHHVNANQSISLKSSIGAYRINYKYGQLKSLFDNPYLLYDSPGDPIPGWSIVGLNVSYPYLSGAGVVLTLIAVGSPVLEMFSDNYSFAAGLELNLVINGIFNRYPPGYLSEFNYRVVFEDAGSADIYYLTPGFAWSLTPFTISESSTANVPFSIDQPLPALPVAGDLHIEIYTAEGAFIPPGGGNIAITEIDFQVANPETSDIKGEFHTFQRTTKPSSKIKDIKEVATGDNVEDNYKGAIYKADGITNTALWNRFGIVDELPILGLMGFETLRASQSPARVFSGSIYGFYEYLSIVTINGLTGFFIPTKYEYDTKENIIEAEFTEIFTDELIDVDYEITLDYGKVIKPTIKG